MIKAYTYRSTSPSLYFEIVEPATIVDKCGQLGRDMSHLVGTPMAFKPGELSSLSFDLAEGVPLSIYSDILASTDYSRFIHTKAIRADEVACPTWGLNDSSPYATIGPPYYPLVVLPEAILSLDPAWEKCKSNSVFFATPGIFDPPVVLTYVWGKSCSLNLMD